MSEAETSPVATNTDQANTARVMPSAAGVDSKAPLPSAYDIPIEDILPVNPRLFNENRLCNAEERAERRRALPDDFNRRKGMDGEPTGPCYHASGR